MEAKEAKHPEKKFKAGAIRATVWNNIQQKDGKEYNYHSVSLDRSYKDLTGAWKQTTSLRFNDLPKAKLVIDEVYRYLALKTVE